MSWQDILMLQADEETWWPSLYLELIPFYAGDINWKILHGALSTNVFVVCFMRSSDLWYFFDERRILEHMNIERVWLHFIYFFLKDLLLRSFPLVSYLYPPHVRHNQVTVPICQLPTGHRTRRRKSQPFDPLQLSLSSVVLQVFLCWLVPLVDLISE